MNSGDDARTGYSCSDWERHYEEEDLRWDLGEAAPPFVRLWKEKKILPCKAIVPGCGAGHEAIFLAEQGFDVTAVDYTHGAVVLLKKSLEKRKLIGEVLRCDFFKLSTKCNESFDLMLEHAFFCAINPNMRQRYVETVGKILKPRGLLIGLFYETNEEGGPPFNTKQEDIEGYFSEQFRIKSLNRTPHSAEQRRGKEWLAVLKKK